MILRGDVFIAVNITVIFQIDDNTACFRFVNGMQFFSYPYLFADKIGHGGFDGTFAQHLAGLLLQRAGKIGITFIGYDRQSVYLMHIFTQ